jgi:hypothetical protein
MPDLKDRFSLVEHAEAPDLWAEARRRAEHRSADRDPASRRGRPSHRAATVAVAFAVFAAAVVFAWDLARPDRRPAPAPRPAVDLAAELPVGWSELPPPPENRSGAATAWTGSELLIWGGYEYTGTNEDPAAGGLAFDAAARRWSVLPASPLDGRSDPAFAWTGSELLVWGGWDGGFRDPPYFDDGAAYDPVRGTWRMLPAAPLSARTTFSVWTGKELIVWGSTDRFDRMRDGAAYDPSTDTWRRIADAPADITDGSAIWTGEEMIVFGAALDGNNHADTPTAIGIAYDPASDTWRDLPPSSLSPQAVTASWLAGEMIAWDYDQATAAYDRTTDAWRALPATPLDFSECRPKSVATSRVVFGEFCGKTVVYSPQERSWHVEPMPVLRQPDDGCCRVHEPVAAGDVVLVPSHVYTGLGVVERRMFVYNPPRDLRGDARGEVPEPDPFLPEAGFGEVDTRMPLVFPDGTRVTLVFPRQLELEQLGVQPNVSYVWRDDPPPRFPIVFLPDPNASIESYVDGSEPVGTVTSYRSIEIWEMSEEWSNRRRLWQGHWLRYGLPSWTVLVALERRRDAEEVAANLAIRQTSSGFPVVEATGPIALPDEHGEGEGPMLAVGSTLDPSVFLWIASCSGGSSLQGSGAYGSACLAKGRVFANVYGVPSTVEAIVEGVRIEDFRAA